MLAYHRERAKHEANYGEAGRDQRDAAPPNRLVKSDGGAADEEADRDACDEARDPVHCLGRREDLENVRERRYDRRREPGGEPHREDGAGMDHEASGGKGEGVAGKGDLDGALSADEV